MSRQLRDAEDPSVTPEEWARQTAARLARGRNHLDLETVREELLDVWRAAVVADEGLDDERSRRAQRPGRLVERARRRAGQGCSRTLPHIRAGPDSIAVHVLPDKQQWAVIPRSDPGPTHGGKDLAWAESTADRIVQNDEQAAGNHGFLRARLREMSDGHRALPNEPLTFSLVDVTDSRLARVDISLRPSAGSDTARRRMLSPPAAAPGVLEVGYYAHHELGVANSVQHFCPPGTIDLGAAPTASLKVLWPLDSSSDLLVVLTTRCAERLLDVLPAVDDLIETLALCVAVKDPPTLDGAPLIAEPARESLLDLLDAETRSRYQVFAENFVRGLGRLPEALELYRPFLEGAVLASDADVAQLRAEIADPNGPFASTQVLLLHAFDSESEEDRVHPLTYCTVGSSFGVFAYQSGTGTPPAWYEELLNNPEALVEVRDRTFKVRARVLDGARREAIWEEQKARIPGLSGYENRTRPVIPVVMLERR